MIVLVQKIRVSDETRAALFVILFTSIFILSQFVLGFQLGLFVVTMAVAVPLIVWRPRAGLSASIALTVLFERFFTLQSVELGRSFYKLYTVDIFLGVVMGAVVLLLLIRKTRMKLLLPDWLVLTFFVFISILFVKGLLVGGSDAGVALSTWKNYIFYGLLYFVVPLLLTEETHLKRLVQFFLASAALAIGFVFIGVVRGEGLWTEFTPLSTSGVRILAFPHAYYFSMALIAVLCSVVYWFAGKSFRRRWVFFGGVSLWLVGILGSLMRHLWLGLVFSLGVLWVFVMTLPQRRALFSVARAFVIAGTGIFVAWLFVLVLLPRSEVSVQSQSLVSTVSDRVTSIGNTADESVAWRGVVWTSALNVFSKNIITGTGFGVSVPVEIDTYREFVEIRNIHNSWLALLIQTGIIGFGLLTGCVMVLVYRVWKWQGKGALLASVRLATLGIVLFQSLIFLSQPYLETNLLSLFFWLNLGIMRSLLKGY
jgi:O-antigen ligase